jgi:hypothetical protein
MKKQVGTKGPQMETYHIGEATKSGQGQDVAPDQGKGLRGIDDLFKDSWNIFAAGWIKYLLFFLLMIGLLLGVVALIAIAIVLAFLVKNIIVITTSIILAVILFMIVATTLALAMNKLVYDVGEQSSDGIKEAVRYGFHHFPAYFLVSLVSGLLIIIGLILLIIPGVVIGTMLSLVAPVFILEARHGISALKRSRELVKGYFWPVFGRLILLTLVSMALSSVQYIVPNIIFLSLVTNTTLMVINFILTYYGVAYSYLIYKDLAMIKKGAVSSS